MFRFFRKSKPAAPVTVDSGSDWSFLGTDMHSHFIPGIDDGPAAMADSVHLIRQMAQRGFRRLVTTPHISMDYFPNKEEDIRTALEGLRTAIKHENIDIELDAAAEYMIDEAFVERLRTNMPLLSIGSGRVLVEMGFVQASPLLGNALFQMQVAGYKPVLAHPERYNYYHGNADALFALKEQGIHMQLNLIALSGYYGKPVKQQAEKLLHEGLYDFAGSDIHHERHLNAYNSVLSGSHYAALEQYPFLNKKL